MNGIKRGFIGPVLAALLGLAALTVPHGAAWADSSAGVLFEQPALDGVDGHFIVPPAEHKKPEPGAFHIILWQPNPNRADGMLSPTEWKAGDKDVYKRQGSCGALSCNWPGRCSRPCTGWTRPRASRWSRRPRS